MKYREITLSGKKIIKEAYSQEDVFLHDEDDRPGMQIMLCPLMLLQTLAVLSLFF